MPEWLVDVLKIAIPVLGSVSVAWITARAAGKAAGQKEQGAIVDRVRALEESEPANVQRAREDAAKALDEAKIAAESAERVAGDMKRHLEEEQQRRRDAREAGQERDRAIASKLDALKDKLTEQGTDLKVLETRLEGAGGSRRGNR